MGEKRSRGRTPAENSAGKAASLTPEDMEAASDTRRALVEYRVGPNVEALAARCGVDVAAGEARRLQQLEAEFGRERVQRWANEGIPVGAMGKPRDMETYREQEADDTGGGENAPSHETRSSGNALAEPVQPNLTVSSPADPAEREAEAVAEHVIEMDTPADSRANRGGEAGTADRDYPDAKVIPTVSARRSHRDTVPGGVGATVRNAISGGGKPLPARTREEFESRMGADFSDVLVHTGTAADDAARSINAEAYTMGADIAFANGNYDTKSTAGRKLIAHELTHVVQQGGAAARVQRQDSSDPETGTDSADDAESGAGGEEESDASREGSPELDDNWLPTKWEEKTYAVTGESCEELVDETDSKDVACEGDAESTDDNVAATTCWGLTLEEFDNPDLNIPANPIEASEDGDEEDEFEVSINEITIGAVDISVSFVERQVVMPEWEGYDEADGNLQDAWDWYIHDLREHEEAHVETARIKRQEIEKALQKSAEEWREETSNALKEEVDGLSDDDRTALRQQLRQRLSSLFSDAKRGLDDLTDDQFNQAIENLRDAQERLHGGEIDETETLDCSGNGS